MMTAAESRQRYLLSFTSGGLLIREADVIVSEYLRVQDWATVRQYVIKQNLLQARTTSTNVRMARETIQRLCVFEDGELRLFAESGLTERCHLMWAAACRRFALVGEFAEEVARERFLLMTPTLGLEDFDRFMTRKSLWHNELDELKPSTRARLRQNLFQMLHEAGLLSEHGDIIPAVLSGRVYETLAARRPSDVRFFPTALPIGVQ
jgi:hypothetical protein